VMWRVILHRLFPSSPKRHRSQAHAGFWHAV